MSSTYAVTGLASGLDTASIVQSLVDLKTQQLITPLENRIYEIEDDQAALDTIKTTLSSMMSAARSLNNISDFNGRLANSSDTTALTISTVSATALQGTYSININQLAQADRNYFNGVADSTAATFGTGTFTITSSGQTIEVTIDSTNNTLEGIRDAINAEDGPVTATIINDGSGATPYRLVLTSNDTGADAEIVQNISSVLSLTDDAALNANSQNIAQDASITVNGLTVTDSTNVITTAIPGVTMNLLTLSTDTLDPIHVTISSDSSSPKTYITNFINAYNDVVADFIDAFEVDTATGKSSGTLASDFTLQSLEERMSSLMMTVQSQLAGNRYQSLSQIGITMDDSGYLVIDDSALTTAMDTYSEDVQRLFQGMSSSVDGISDKAYDLLYSMVNTADGILTQKNQIWQENIDDMTDEMDKRQTRIDAYEEMLQAKFAYMEELISKLNSISSSLESSQSALDNVNSQISS